jgi:hypothetical protein
MGLPGRLGWPAVRAKKSALKRGEKGNGVFIAGEHALDLAKTQSELPIILLGGGGGLEAGGQSLMPQWS